MNTDRAARLAHEQAERRRVDRQVALELRAFVAQRYPERAPGLVYASDYALWRMHGRELVEYEEAAHAS